MANTTVGAVKYDAYIDLASLKKSVEQADKLIEQSYKKQSQNAQKSSKETTKVASKDAQTRVDAVKREAEQTAKTISSYTPQIQKQFLTVERANNQVASATVRAQNAIQKYGVDSVQATKATSSLSVAVKNQSQQQARLQSMLDGTATKTSGFSDAMTKAGAVAGATAAVVGTVLNKALAMVSSSVGSAVSRIDTLNNAPKVLKNLGFSAQESSDAIQKLSNGIQGLPTSLDSATSALLAITSASGKSAEYATDLTLAFNNMALAGGKGPAEAQRALTQFTQALGRGKFNMQDFNTLAEVMPAQLNQVAKTLLGAGDNTRTLGTALSDGTLSIEQFNDEVIRLNKTGGDGFASFSEQAKDATSGIGTSFANMQTAITRGVSKIIDSIGSDNLSKAVTAVGAGFESVLGSISGIINYVSTKGVELTDWINENKTLVTNLSIVIGSLLIPQIIKMGVQSTIAMAKYATGLAIAVAQTTIASARMAASWLLALGPIGIVIAAVGAATALIIANWDSIKNFVFGVWGSIVDAVSAAFNWIKDNWANILGILTLPFGGAVILIIRHFDKIKSVVGNVWEWIKGVFGTIGSVASTIIKAPVNAIISFAENTINGFIKAVNGAISTINKIPGVDIGKLASINIPKLAEGGIVQARPGGILANIGEGGEDEAVIPLSKLEKMMNGSTNNSNVTVNLNLSGVMSSSKADERAIAERIAKLINQAVKARTGSEAIVGI